MWKPGDIYWQAQGSLNGSECDLGVYGQEQIERQSAEANAEDWLDSLSDRERRHAQTWVRQYHVDDVSEDGKIDMAHTID